MNDKLKSICHLTSKEKDEIILSQMKEIERIREKFNADMAKQEEKYHADMAKQEDEHHADMAKQEASYHADLAKYIAEIADIRHQLNNALNALYGKSSEKLPNAAYAFDEATQPDNTGVTDITEADEAIGSASPDDTSMPEDGSAQDDKTRKKKKSRGRRPLPKHLERVMVIHDLSDAEKRCACCGEPLFCIGEDSSEQLEFIPAKARVIKNIRKKYACRGCAGNVKMAVLPLQPIPKSISTPGLLAYIIVSKYEDHLPLYRQEDILQRMGVDIFRATLSFWMLRCAELVKPLIELLRELICKGDYTQVDETPVQVLNERDKSNVSKSYMWVYRGGPLDKRVIVYDYRSSRAGICAHDFLNGFSGVLQADGYSGYNGFSGDVPVVRAGCMAHVRRKFFEIVRVAKRKRGKAHEAMEFISQLYGIEKHARENNFTVLQRQTLRQAEAIPILSKFKVWLDETYQQVPKQSAIGKAIQYALNQWSRLIVYVEHGRVEIDNNLVENDIRPFALGRKNWLFMGSDSGAEAGAAFYSLLATCKEHLIEPYAYFKYILDQLPRRNPKESLMDLLPQFIDRSVLINAYSQTTWSDG